MNQLTSLPTVDRLAGLRHGAGRWALAAFAAATSVGCVDAERLTEARRNKAHGYQLAEVDLGKYHVPLPQLPNVPGGGVVDFHAFGQVTNRHKKAIEQQLELRGPELRHRILLAVRELDQSQIDQPELTSLRTVVAEAVNGMLDEAQLEGVGFYAVSYYAL